MKQILINHLNDNKKVFVHSYNNFQELFEVTKTNVDSFSTVDISDDMLDDTTVHTHEERVEYFTVHMKQDKIVKMLNELSLVKMYHVDCEADVYILEQKDV